MMISVALCSFNGASYIEKQVVSILNQTIPVDEIVVCDDRSTDHTVQIVKQLAQNSAIPIRLFQNEPSLGVTRNFEKAISLCKGEIVFLCDQDDLWETDKVEKMVRAFGENTVYVFSDGKLIDTADSVTDDSMLDRFHYGLSKNSLLDIFVRKTQYPNGCLLAVRKSFFHSILPFPQSKCGLYHDTWLGITAPLFGACRYVDFPLIRYRIHEASITQGSAGQDNWKATVSAGDAYDRRFGLNEYREERVTLMKRAIDLCRTSGMKPNRFFRAYLKVIYLYDQQKKIKSLSIWKSIWILCLCFLKGAYAYRILDRDTDNSVVSILKFFISDILFVIKLQRQSCK